MIKENTTVDIFSQIKSLIDIITVLEYYGVRLDNKNYALCPFHSEGTPSFKVYDDNFYCFGCGTGGDLINFVMKLFSLTSIEAAKQLNDDFHLNIVSGTPGSSRLAIKKIHEDKNLIADFTEWEKASFRSLANCYRILQFRGEMLFVHGVKYFEQYLPEIENIGFVKYLLDTMIENIGDFEAQANFTVNMEGRWI